MQQLKRFLLALSFYTRLPCPGALDYKDLPKASLHLPLIGWLVGGILAACFSVANGFWPQTTAVMLTISLGIFLTGALHEDGFADVCDGFGGGYTKQQILDIMKDSRIGVYGVLGLLLLVLLKISLLSNTPTSAVPILLLAGHSISRLAPLCLMYRYAYARENDSKAAVALYKPQPLELTVAVCIALLPLGLLPGLCLLAALPVWLVNHGLGHYFYRQIGGYTGDCLGASQQVAETVFYLSVQALWTFI